MLKLAFLVVKLRFDVARLHRENSQLAHANRRMQEALKGFCDVLRIDHLPGDKWDAMVLIREAIAKYKET